MKKTIVVVKDNDEEFVLSFDYIHMAMNDPHAVFVFCPQTRVIYKSVGTEEEK